MNKLLALLLCLTLGLPLPLLAQTFPPIAVTGPEIPGNNYDDDGDGVTDEIPATSISEDPDAKGNYHFHFKDCEKVGFANVADTTFPDSIRVEKPAGATIIEGEMVCYIPNLPAGTYTLHLLYSTPSGTRAVWPGVNKSLRYQMKPEEASILPANNTPQWLPLIYTGTAANYYAGANGGDQVQFVWKGGSFALAFKGDEARYGCGYLAIGVTSKRTCPGETGTEGFQGYTMYELGKTEAVPTAYNSAAFTNAHPMVFSGSEIGAVCGGTVTVKGLWQNTTTDRQFWSIVCNDTEAVTVTTVNDALTMPAANEDAVDIRYRGDLSALFDTNTYMVKGNLQPVYFDADWSGTANARNPAVNLNTTVTRNINAGVSWNMFIAADIGFSVTPDTIGLFNLAIIDYDAAGGAFKYFHGNSVTDIAQFGGIKWALATVPPSGGGTDTTAPVVTSPAIPAGTVTQSSFIMTANTNEQGTCRMRVGTSTGNYNLTAVTGTQSVNGVCSVAKTGLSAGVTFYAVIDVIDVAGNVGTSSEVSTTTDAPDPPNNCTKFAGPTAQGAQDGSSDANRYLVNGFWTSGHAVPGAVLCLADGTYKGSASMITPTAGLNGNSLNPIIIKATNDGGPWIHGEDVRRPVTLSNNDYWILEGFNASNSHINAVSVGSGSSNNIIRRVCAWNAVPAYNERVWGITGTATNTLLEDVCGFGANRRIFAITQGGNSTIIRRAWAVFEKTGGGGPDAPYQFAYNGETHVLENVIGTWKQTVAGDSTGSERALLHLANEGTNHKLLGSFFYVRSGDMFSPTSMAITSWAAIPHGPFEIRDVTFYTEQATKRAYNLAGGGTPCTSCTVTNSTEIGGATSSIHANWIQSNRRGYTDIATATADDANPFQSDGSTTRARMCFRYGGTNPFVGGVLTTEKLWPWPMDSRINAALVLAGKNPNDYFGTGLDLTGFIESKFGEIPSGCKN